MLIQFRSRIYWNGQQLSVSRNCDNPLTHYTLYNFVSHKYLIMTKYLLAKHITRCDLDLMFPVLSTNLNNKIKKQEIYIKSRIGGNLQDHY